MDAAAPAKLLAMNRYPYQISDSSVHLCNRPYLLEGGLKNAAARVLKADGRRVVGRAVPGGGARATGAAFWPQPPKPHAVALHLYKNGVKQVRTAGLVTSTAWLTWLLLASSRWPHWQSVSRRCGAAPGVGSLAPKRVGPWNVKQTSGGARPTWFLGAWW